MGKSWSCNHCKKRYTSETPPGDCTCGCRLFSETPASEAPPLETAAKAPSLPPPPARASRAGVWAAGIVAGLLAGLVLGGFSIYAFQQRRMAAAEKTKEHLFENERNEFRTRLNGAVMNIEALKKEKIELEQELNALEVYQEKQDQRIEALSAQKESLEKKLEAAIKKRDELQAKLEAVESALPRPPGSQKQDRYLVVDLSGGPRAAHYPVTYLSAPPHGGWTDEYKGNKLVLRRIEPGSFLMGSPASEIGRLWNEALHRVTLTQPFYIGVFELTQKQWRLITGDDPSRHKGDFRPVECVSYDDIRSILLSRIRARTDIEFDLPTEAQWEYACRAGTRTALNTSKNLKNGEDDFNMSQAGRYSYNQSDGKGGYTSYHTKVGSYQPNAWGLYDMHGNVLEWCLDWYTSNLGTAAVTDPKDAGSGSDRVVRGGNWFHDAQFCRSAYRDYYTPSGSNSSVGLRVLALPAVRESGK